MPYDFCNVRGVHPSQHLGEIRNSSATEQPLHGDQDDVGLRLASFGLIAQGLSQRLLVDLARALLDLFWLRYVFHRLHHTLTNIPAR